MAGVGSVPAAWAGPGYGLLRGHGSALSGAHRPARGRGGSNPDQAHGRVQPGSGERAGQIQNGRCAAPKKRPGANKTAVATVLADIDLTPPFDLNLGLNLGLNHTKNLRFKPRFKPGFFCGGFKPRFKPRVGVRCMQ